MPKYNLGRKPSKVTEAPMQDKEIYYPSISVSTEDAKGLKLKIGQKVKLIGVVTGLDEQEKVDKEKETRYNIDIEQLNKGYTEEEYSNLSEEKKDEADLKDLESKKPKEETEE